jgi:hypothetical protein
VHHSPKLIAVITLKACYDNKEFSMCKSPNRLVEKLDSYLPLSLWRIPLRIMHDIDCFQPFHLRKTT